MPGRQSTGPAPLLRARPQKKPKRKRALDAFALAEAEEAGNARIRASRLGQLEGGGESDNDGASSYDEDDEDGDGKRESKRLKRGKRGAGRDLVEGDSDGNGDEWNTGRASRDDDDDDSSIDSDEAMGPSDEERFEGFKFGNNTSIKATKHRKLSIQDEDEIDLNEEATTTDSDAESEGFAAEAMDLAQVLDRRDSASEDEGVEDSQVERSSELSFSEDDELDGLSSHGLSGLQKFITSLDGSKKTEKSKLTADAHEGLAPSSEGITSRTKLTLSDMLDKSSDPAVRKQLRSKKGKLAVPLAKRQQDRIDRSAAYDQSKETLGRWVESVKQNRRAEHLEFPLPDPSAAAAKSNLHLSVDSTTKPINGLELAIQNILEQSGMDDESGKTMDDQVQAFEELAANKMPIEEVRARRAQLRRTRELLFREEIKAKRIKKIKSKSWRRVHRKERERDAQREREMMAEAGIEPDENEQERLYRLRAEERVSGKHRASRWAKSVKATRRGAWDEDARAGMQEMARREEELKKRIEGEDPYADSLDGSQSDSDDESSENEDASRARRLEKLNKLRGSDSAPSDGLNSLAFMQKAEAARKARNDEDIERLRRELAGEETPDEDSDDDAPVGRRIFGPQTTKSTTEASEQAREEFEERAEDEYLGQDAADAEVSIVTDRPTSQVPTRGNKSFKAPPLRNDRPADVEDDVKENPWLSISKKSGAKLAIADKKVHITTDAELPVQLQRKAESRSTEPTTVSKSSRTKLSAPAALQTVHLAPSDEHSDSEPTTPPPTNEALIRQAFAADEVLAEEDFAAEKAALEEEEAAAAAGGDTKQERMPGWGSWVGEGVPASTKKPPRSSSTVAKATPASASALAINGFQAGATSTLDTKLASAVAANPRVMISSKTIKANAPYRATQLPHPFETRTQYERALRLPVGQEWVTRQTFLEGTKPRVNVRKGEVIRAMRKPLA